MVAFGFTLAVIAVITLTLLSRTSLLALLLALIVDGGWRERAQRVRQHALWWPVVVYVTWTLLVLAFGAHYPQTPSNAVHGLRIAATVLMALALSRDEAVWALRGFLAMSVAGLAMIALYYSVGFPMTEAFRGLLVLVGNKSISNALLLTIFGATAAVLGLALLTAHRPWRALVAFGFTLAVIAVITLTLLSRTSLLALLLAVGIWQSPAVQQKFELGVQELEAAQAGAVSEGSWVVRYYMYRDTARMIIDRPLTGWGIGAWTEQWHLRGPKLLADYNMPHNDFLWMGAQAGLPGALSLLAIILTGVWQAWRRPDLTGRFALMAMFVLLVATSANSALRDAQIGLSLLWVAMIYLRLVQEPGEPWRDLWPRRSPALDQLAP
ncbi:MAG: O-antigen ligase family protein [Comamonadaceae bacterium]|nr:MAG: O-antigen ligase family protein [Comamonadaceae bacterium]